MKAELRQEDRDALFVLLDLDADEAAAARELAFEVDGGTAARRVRPVPDLESIFARFADRAQTLLDQTAGRVPTPWDRALETALDLASDVEWWVTGRAALAARGIDVAPRDVDLVTSVEGAHELADRLGMHLIEPPALSSDWIADTFGRAFPGARLEWAGGVHASVDEAGPGDFGPAAEAQLETIVWRGHPIRVPPLELQLAVTRRRGLDARAAAIEAALRRC